MRDITHAFMRPGEHWLIDVAQDDGTGTIRSFVGKLTLDEMRAREKRDDILCLPFDEACAVTELNARKHYCRPPVEIDEAEWEARLDDLPPQKWVDLSGVESWHCLERTSGPLAAWYVRIGDRRFCLTEDTRKSNDEIVEIVRVAIEGK